MEHEGNEKPTPVTQSTGKTRRPPPDILLPPKNDTAGGKPGNRYEEMMLPDDVSMESATEAFMRADIDREGNEKPTPVTQSTEKTRLPAPDVFVPVSSNRWS
ncbi:uncharacterized protein LOC125941430 isoform X2 [Dermacentor silvarum]|uniref:uncharacterized protein LOC125941430 isoform X2 n=1 Tax=Dermacentor silvarum TaxID=543639 RepID=UPI0021011045|nr:uncharacterized protein LOC125941430 isoform X2 [Dermacentor silvarum]